MTKNDFNYLEKLSFIKNTLQILKEFEEKHNLSGKTLLIENI